MTWNPLTWNKAILKRALFAAVLFPPVIGFSNSPKHERSHLKSLHAPTSSRVAVPYLTR